ncbi:MAG: alternate-type signal peptide domain-containing protein [Pseudolysinimonas sp.]
MNKLTKGAIAGAAGIILLMGGAGSLAYWNDSATAGPATGTTITAGTLTISAVDAGVWKKQFFNAVPTQVGSDVAVTNAGLAAVRIVPGNKLTYTQTFNLNATGDDLYFTIGSSNGSVAAASGAAADVALAAQSTGTFTIGTVSAGNVALTGVTAGVYKVTTAGTSTITVTWVINFPFGASAVNTAKGGVLSLTQGAITVTQVAAP